MSKAIIHIIRFVLLLGLQIVVFNQLELLGRINPQIYLYFLLVLPMGIHRAWLVVIGFTTGLLMDGFTNTAGLHAAVCALVAFSQPYILKRIVDEPDEIYNNLNLYQLSFGVITVYFVVMILIHHMFLYFLEAFSFDYALRTIKVALLSGGISLTLFLIFRYSFSWYSSYRR